jgi:hypothetical protein
MSRENIGMLVRRARIDLGIRIDLDIEQTRALGDLKLCKSHFSIGRIHYGDIHGPVKEDGKDPPPTPPFDDPNYYYEQNQGILVYLKVGLTGDEPNDLFNYRSENPEFPHHPINDQFFDEAQFESYRTLGIHTARMLLEGDVEVPPAQQSSDSRKQVEKGVYGQRQTIQAMHCTITGGGGKEVQAQGQRWTNRELFKSLYDRWLPPPPNLSDAYTHNNEVCASILARLGSVSELQPFALELYGDPEQQEAAAAIERNDEKILLAERLMVLEMGALLENAWIGIDLEHYRRHPVHQGWMATFRHWTRSKTFRRHWPAVSSEFSPSLIRFIQVVMQEDDEAQRKAATASGAVEPVAPPKKEEEEKKDDIAEQPEAEAAKKVDEPLPPDDRPD